MSIIVYIDHTEEISDSILYLSMILIGISGLIPAISPIFLNKAEYSETDIEKTIKTQLDDLEKTENTKNEERGKGYISWKFE